MKILTPILTNAAINLRTLGTAFKKGAAFAKDNPEAVGATADMAKVDQKYASMAADAGAGAAAAEDMPTSQGTGGTGGKGGKGGGKGGGLPSMPPVGDSVNRKVSSFSEPPRVDSTNSSSSKTDLEQLPEMDVAPPGQSMSVEGRGAYDDPKRRQG